MSRSKMALKLSAILSGFELEPKTIEKEIDMDSTKGWEKSGKYNFPRINEPLVPKLDPGFYNIAVANGEVYFTNKQILDQNILRFPQNNCDGIISEIEKFWEKEELYKQFGLVYKRGIMLYGVPGGGKTSIIQLIIRDVINNRNGIVVNFEDVKIFNAGMSSLRMIEPDLPVVVLMEDIDSILGRSNESDILNILDGVNSINKVVYLATTNYPERLGERIINRPSRFDVRYEIGLPNRESREIFFNHLCNGQETSVDLDRFLDDTEGFTLAHIKEFFVSIVILGYSHDKALRTINNMQKNVVDSKDFETNKPKKEMGFATFGLARKELK